MTLNELCMASAEMAKTKGFSATFPEFIALTHSELSEALEEFRNGRELNETYYNGGEGTVMKPEGIPIEIADAVIRIAHFCGAHGIDLEKAIKEKAAYNATRPYKHGGKKL